LANTSRIVAFFSFAALMGAMLVALSLSRAQAAQLVMFEQPGCPWCEAFDRDVGVIYAKTDEAKRAPLRRLDINEPLPPNLSFIQVERLTPLFVLVDKGHEIGRIRGYGGEEMFWTQLYMLMQKLKASGSGKDHAHIPRNPEKTQSVAG
jgi:hypothetical protein